MDDLGDFFYDLGRFIVIWFATMTMADISQGILNNIEFWKSVEFDWQCPWLTFEQETVYIIEC